MPRFLGAAILALTMGAAMTEAAQPPKPGDEMLRAYIQQEALKLDRAYLKGIRSRRGWERLRDDYRRQLLYMFGLWPLPKRTPLEATVTGTLDRGDFVVEKLHFQSRPQLYVTANFYRPKAAKGKLPTVLYVCGHAGRGRDGNKSAYQHHGIWFATHGYNCLMIDTLQLGEIAAIHHGTYKYNRWWWHSRGYTSAGVECWNCIRALDYLGTRPEVDPARIAVTGRSGGGAYSFWVAATDDRVAVAVPVSGMSDLEDYTKPPVVNGHCDCMFVYNSYQWPWTRIASLVGPRPLLFCNSDKDRIFPMPGNERIIARLRRFYKLLGHPDRVDAFVTPGPHKDVPPLREAAFTWLNRFLKHDPTPVKEPQSYPKIPGKLLRAFPGELPANQLNTKIDETFVPVARVPVPTTRSGYHALRRHVLDTLRETTFRAWPHKGPTKRVELAGDPAAGRYPSEPPIEIAYRYFPPDDRRSRTCWLLVLNEGEADDTVPEWAADLVGPHACVLLSPRGVGPTERTFKKPYYFLRAMALLGRTLDSGRVWDAMAFVAGCGRPRTTWKAAGRGQAGVLAAYAALYEKKITEIVCVDPPSTHDDGPHFLSVMRTLDIPDALGLLAPRPLTLRGAKAKPFDKTTALYRAADARRKLRRR